MNKLIIQPVSRPVDGIITVPGSKSITNRALALAALADGESSIRGALFSDDTERMADSLDRLGIAVESHAGIGAFNVSGQGGRIPATEADLFVGNSGTTARFITALTALGYGRYRIDGIERMRERPIEDLLNALRQLGIDAKSENDTGCPPIVVQANGIRGGRTSIRADISSQYLTALLMAAPLAKGEVTIDVEGDLASKPYIEITLRMMEQWGVNVGNRSFRRFEVSGGQKYRAQAYCVEPDASSASYFFAAAAVTGGRARVTGLSRQSMQGDIRFVDALARMGCAADYGADYIEVRGGPLHGIEIDMNAISDTVMTLAVAALFASSPTTIRNVAHIRHKETDRVTAAANELRRLGATVDEYHDGLKIHPPEKLRPAEIRTYDDHRMAMSFAVAGLISPGVTILDHGCVRKTFPDFFARLNKFVGTSGKQA